MVDLTSYQDLYITSAFNYLQKLKDSLVVYIKNLSDTKTATDLHLYAHALKGQSYVMGFQTTGDLCKELEYIFRAAKEGTTPVTESSYKSIMEAVQALTSSLENIKQVQKELDLSAEKKLLETATGIQS